MDRRTAVFAALEILSLILCWHPLVRLFQLAWNSEQYSHILLVIPASVILLAFENRERFVVRRSWFAACMLISFGVALGVASASAASDVQLFLQIVGLVTFWIAAYVLCFGWQPSLAFPVLFLFFLAPLPSAVMQKIIFFLQYGSTEVAYLFLKWFSVPVVKTGFVLSLPTLNIEVAQECSGIRSSITLLLTTLVLSHLYLKSRWRQALVCASVVPLAIIKNGFRVFILSSLATYRDPSWLDGRLHHNGGVLFFALALGVVSALIIGFHRSEQAGQPTYLTNVEGKSKGKLLDGISVPSPYRRPTT